LLADGHYVILQPRLAEGAFTVVDQYQARGLGTVLLRPLAAIARGVGIHEFIALSYNPPMMRACR